MKNSTLCTALFIFGLCFGSIVTASSLSSQTTIPRQIGAVNFAISKLPAAVISAHSMGAK